MTAADRNTTADAPTPRTVFNRWWRTPLERHHGTPAESFFAALDAAGYDVVLRTPDTPTMHSASPDEVLDWVEHLLRDTEWSSAAEDRCRVALLHIDAHREGRAMAPDTPTDETVPKFPGPHDRPDTGDECHYLAVTMPHGGLFCNKCGWATPDTPTDTDSDTAARARALLDAATPGPWGHVPPLEGGTIHRVVQLATDDELPFRLCRMEDAGYSARASWDQRKADAELIAAAPTLITDLLSEVDRLHSLTEGDPNTIYHEAAQLRAERDAAVARADALTVAIDPRFRDCWTPRTTGATGDVSELGEAPCGDCPGCRLDDALDRGTDRQRDDTRHPLTRFMKARSNEWGTDR